MKDLFIITCAVIGAVLGILNTWHAYIERRVKLVVVPKTALPVYGTELGPEMGCIEVTNLSGFPVTIREVGFTNGDPRKEQREVITRPSVVDGGPWPRRLDSRTSVSLYFDQRNLSRRFKKAYALTDCGQVGYGK